MERVELRGKMRVFIIAIVFAQVFTTPTFSQLSQRSVEILARALPFIPHIQIGELSVGIVFDEKSVISTKEKDTLLLLLGSGYQVGKYNLIGHAIMVTQLQNLRHFDIIIVTEDTRAFQGEIYEIALTQHILTVSSDFECVLAGNCVLGITTSPKVKIIVNAHARAECQINFAQAFRLLVHEV